MRIPDFRNLDDELAAVVESVMAKRLLHRSENVSRLKRAELATENVHRPAQSKMHTGDISG